ncbi:hypothetical protein BG004_002073 [Podila humilis]|nr:hypothetical protein BG004_002073 [Podila humilis]
MSSPSPTPPADAPQATHAKVLIVGAGIGGLVLAALLEKAGIEYEVFERARTVVPLGSAISLGANVMYFFEQLGVADKVIANAQYVDDGNQFNEKMENVCHYVYRYHAGRYGYYSNIIARPVLYDIIAELVPKEKIHYGMKVLSILQNKEGVMVRCWDNSTRHGDILVGADGAYSAVRQTLYSQLDTKGLLPKSDKEHLPFTNVCLVGTTDPLDTEKYPYVQGDSTYFVSVIADKVPYSWVLFSTKGNRICWMVVEHLNNKTSKLNDTFRSTEWGPETAEAMIKEVRDFALPHGCTIGDFIDQTPKEYISKVMLEEKLFETWHNGRTVLLGDACHKMHPAAGLGAVSAIHDAIVLANRLYHLKSTPRDRSLKIFEACTKVEDIKEVFRAYKEERYPLTVQSYAASKQMARTLDNKFLNRLSRKMINHIPLWLWFRMLDKLMEYRPQCTFLPIVNNRGTVKPAIQESLYLAEQFPQPLKGVIGSVQSTGVVFDRQTRQPKQAKQFKHKPKSPLDHVLELPEIVERISAHLDRRTITYASRVARAWYQAYLPILWHTIDNGRHWTDPRFLKAIAKHGSLIRVLVCSRYDEIDLLLPPTPTPQPQQQQEHQEHQEYSPSDSTSLCSHLVTLVLPKTTTANQRQHALLIRQNPHLRDLSLTFHDELSSHFVDLTEAIGELKHLQRLAFDENKTLEAKTLEAILEKCSRGSSSSSSTSEDGDVLSIGSLHELSFNGAFFMNKHPFGSGEEFASGLLASPASEAQMTRDIQSYDTAIETKPHFAIATLRMNSVACMQDLLLNLTSRFPHLTRLSLRESAEVYFGNDFPTRLAQRCPGIKWLDISETEDMEDETIASLISCFPGLTTLHAQDTRFGSLSLKALGEHCRDLAVLDIESAYDVDSVAMQQFLSKSWSLRTLNAYGVQCDVVHMMKEAIREQRRKKNAGGFYTRGSNSNSSTSNTTTTNNNNSNSANGTGSSERGLDGSTWACHRLETLVIGINYTRSSLSENERKLYPPSRARRFLYDQLGRLTKLRYLGLETALDIEEEEEEESENEEKDAEERKVSSDDDEDELEIGQGHHLHLAGGSAVVAEGENWENEDLWMDYSFKSGLRRLESLKELRTLCLLNVKHKIRLEEINWMVEHWPHLLRFEFLDWGNMDEDEEAEMDGILRYCAEHYPWIEFADNDY